MSYPDVRKMKLYLLAGSKHSRLAELLVERAFPGCKIHTPNLMELSRIDLELGIRQLPALVTENNLYEGFKSIKEFCDDRV